MSNDRMHDLDASNKALWAEVKAVRAENDRLRAELSDRADLDYVCAQLNDAEAAIARVRELCASHAGDDKVSRASVLEAIEGEQS